jgi:hypothetical protein
MANCVVYKKIPNLEIYQIGTGPPMAKNNTAWLNRVIAKSHGTENRRTAAQEIPEVVMRISVV